MTLQVTLVNVKGSSDVPLISWGEASCHGHLPCEGRNARPEVTVEQPRRGRPQAMLSCMPFSLILVVWIGLQSIFFSHPPGRGC